MGSSKRYIKIGRDRYYLRDTIDNNRYLKLKSHSQFHLFVFKRVSKQWRWYVKSNANSLGLTTTEREQNQILIKSYNKWLNSNKEIN